MLTQPVHTEARQRKHNTRVRTHNHRHVSTELDQRRRLTTQMQCARNKTLLWQAARCTCIRIQCIARIHAHNQKVAAFQLNGLRPPTPLLPEQYHGRHSGHSTLPALATALSTTGGLVPSRGATFPLPPLGIVQSPSPTGATRTSIRRRNRAHVSINWNGKSAPSKGHWWVDQPPPS